MSNIRFRYSFSAVWTYNCINQSEQLENKNSLHFSEPYSAQLEVIQPIVTGSTVLGTKEYQEPSVVSYHKDLVSDWIYLILIGHNDGGVVDGYGAYFIVAGGQDAGGSGGNIDVEAFEPNTNR